MAIASLDGNALRAGLWRSRASLPLILAVPTLALYFMAGPPDAKISPAQNWAPLVLIGALIGLAAWIGVSYYSGTTANPQAANRRSYAELNMRREYLQNALDLLKVADPARPNETLASTQIKEGLERLEELLKASPDMDWASGLSYITAWNELHRAEAQLLLLQDDPTVISEANSDKLRLTGSKIPQRQQFTDQLDQAIKELETKSRQGSATPDPAPRQEIAKARLEIFDYVDTRYEGLIRLASSLRSWRLVLGLVVYALFIVAILSVDRASDPGLVESFAVYFVIGAGAGAIGELWRRRVTRPEVDDYGVRQARFLVIPSLAGSAACGGVFIVGILADSSLAEALTQAVDFSKLTIAAAPALAIAAAVFGVAPGRFLGSLDALGEQLSQSISATESTDTKDSDDND